MSLFFRLVSKESFSPFVNTSDLDIIIMTKLRSRTKKWLIKIGRVVSIE